MPGLWYSFGSALAQGILEGASLQDNAGTGDMVPARLDLPALEGACSHQELRQAGFERPELQKHAGVGTRYY